LSKKKSHSNISFGRGTWSAIALAMLGLAVVAGFYFEQSTRISAVEFSGHEFTTEDALQEALISPVGLLADSVDYAGIYSSLIELPYVRDVAVRMTYRGTLTVEVTERKPVGLLAVKPETYFDSAGVQLPAQPGIGVDVPLVYGFKPTSPGDTLKGKGFDQIKEFLNAASRDPFGWATLSEVAWNENEGVVALSSENGVKLLFGRNRFDQKVSHWKTFYQDVVAHRGINDFRTVDLRFRNQIVTDEL
jgi:hypothetical protein